MGYLPVRRRGLNLMLCHPDKTGAPSLYRTAILFWFSIPPDKMVNRRTEQTKEPTAQYCGGCLNYNEARPEMKFPILDPRRRYVSAISKLDPSVTIIPWSNRPPAFVDTHDSYRATGDTVRIKLSRTIKWENREAGQDQQQNQPCSSGHRFLTGFLPIRSPAERKATVFRNAM